MVVFGGELAELMAKLGTAAAEGDGATIITTAKAIHTLSKKLVAECKKEQR